MSGLFDICVERTLKCPHCKAETHPPVNPVDELGLTIQLRAGRQVNRLTTLIKDYFEGDVSPERRCENCPRTSDTPTKARILAAPEALIIMIVRFKLLQGGTKQRKDSKRVIISPYLSLSEYAVPRISGSLRYQLVSVANHSGTMTGGHHITTTLTPRRNWIQANDSRLSKADFEAAVDPEGNFTPYILFYKRLHPETEE